MCSDGELSGRGAEGAPAVSAMGRCLPVEERLTVGANERRRP